MLRFLALVALLSPPEPGSVKASAPAVLAEVEGEPITEADVAEAGGAAYARLQQQLFELRRQRVSELIDRRLAAREAARRGTSVQELLEAEVTTKAVVSEEEAKAYVAARPGEFRERDPLEARVAQARARMAGLKLRTRRQEFFAELRSRARISDYLQPPEPYRAPVDAKGERVRGPAAAPVTIVEFSDFHCPFCRRVQPALDRVRATYGDKVRLVYRDFPLDATHAGARRAAEAARCAGEQGKFWEFHDVLYRNEADASDAALGRLAGQAGVEGAALLACVASGRQAAAVSADGRAGAALGVNSTPTFFVNGRPLAGARSFESFSRLIDEELGRVAKGAEAAGH
jgi:protein-disulfide isomerase